MDPVSKIAAVAPRRFPGLDDSIARCLSTEGPRLRHRHRSYRGHPESPLRPMALDADGRAVMLIRAAAEIPGSDQDAPRNAGIIRHVLNGGTLASAAKMSGVSQYTVWFIVADFCSAVAPSLKTIAERRSFRGPILRALENAESAIYSNGGQGA